MMGHLYPHLQRDKCVEITKLIDDLEANLLVHPNELAELYFKNKTKLKRSKLLSFVTAR